MQTSHPRSANGRQKFVVRLMLATIFGDEERHCSSYEGFGLSGLETTGSLSPVGQVATQLHA